jgi:hypothetical protein
MNLNAKEMHELSEQSRLENILAAIRREAEQSLNKLYLYDRGIYFGYGRIFKYDEKELQELRAKGFKITEITKTYKLFIFFGQKFTQTYHEIEW